jgi:4-methoxybenzoate monooxygenase (O-demethylating)
MVNESRDGLTDQADIDPQIPAVTIDPFQESFLSDPVRHYASLRNAGPIFHLSKYGIYGMAQFASVKAALDDHSTFCSGRGVGLSDFSRETPWRPPSLLLETDPPEHDRTRRIVNRIVSLTAIRNLSERWAQAASQLVDVLVTRQNIDFMTDVAEVFPLSVFPDAIGIQKTGRENLLPYASATFNAFGPRNELFEATSASAAQSIQWVAESCKRINLQASSWGMAVHEAADRGECTEAEAERLVRSFLSAGVDTTVNGIGNMLYAFSQHPEQWQRLRETPALAKKAFEESLRWLSTVQTFFRTTTRAIKVEGCRVPEGSKVLLFLAAANRDPQKYADADAFQIDRPLGGHVGFGSGIHACLGQMVARLEGELVLSALLRKVHSIRPAGPAVKRLNNTLLAFSHIPVELQCIP